MNKMIVSPWLSVSPNGPETCAHDSGLELVHLRQGEMDGACGPYSLVMALIMLGAMSRDDACNLHGHDGRTREGKFREKLLEFGSLVSGGTDGMDLCRLAANFKGFGITCEVLDIARRRKTTVNQIAQAIDLFSVPILKVEWDKWSAHWVVVVGYQGYQLDETQELQVTHLLCLDPGSEAPRVSLWNAVIEAFDEQGQAVNEGHYYCRHWGSTGVVSDCRISSSLIIERNF